MGMHLSRKDKSEYWLRANLGDPISWWKLAVPKGCIAVELERFLVEFQQDNGQLLSVRRFTTVAPTVVPVDCKILQHLSAVVRKIKTWKPIRKMHEGRASDTARWKQRQLMESYWGQGQVKAGRRTTETGLIWQMLDQGWRQPE